MEQPELTELEKEIVNLIGNCRGEHNALRRRNLAEMLIHFGDERKIRVAIKHLVTSHGVPIASSPAGYFTPVTLEEIWRTCDYYHSYAMSALSTESKLRKLIDRMIGQSKIDFSRQGAKGAKEAQG